MSKETELGVRVTYSSVSSQGRHNWGVRVRFNDGTPDVILHGSSPSSGQAMLDAHARSQAAITERMKLQR